MGELDPEVAAWRSRFDEVVTVWQEFHAEMLRQERERIAEWSRSFDEFASEAGRLRSSGHWFSGPTDFMGVLWLGHDEVRNCRVLAWLMDPSGSHGLGSALLERIAARAPVDVVRGSSPESFRVSTEQELLGTRADIVVRTAQGTLVIEAKVNAPESDGQTAAYQHHWGDNATFIYLTRNGDAPSADDPSRWARVSWASVGFLLDEALGEGNPAAPGRSIATGYRDAIRQHLQPWTGRGQYEVDDIEEEGDSHE